MWKCIPESSLEWVVYVVQPQPPIFEDSSFAKNVYKLHKALYGLTQDPHAWYKHLGIYSQPGIEIDQTYSTIFY
jgi:hypothetical protein